MNYSLRQSGCPDCSRDLLIGGRTLRRETSIRTSNLSLGNCIVVGLRRRNPIAVCPREAASRLPLLDAWTYSECSMCASPAVL
jgi:hypothetical protein